MSHNLNHEEVLLIGTGGMAVEYARVLANQSVPFITIGRGAAGCEAFTAATGRPAHTGGLQQFVNPGASAYSSAIVAVGVADLAPVCLQLIKSGTGRILLEKPGANSIRELATVVAAAEDRGAAVYLAYNRRFYASARRAREIVAEDGGVTSFTFEFTEWSHQIEALSTPAAIKQNWFMANSTHVCDLAFFLGGSPARWHAESAGSLPWHPSAAVFVGSGISTSGALFAYHANWDSAGRWGIELLTRTRRLILRPMERLSEMRRGSVAVSDIDLADDLDTRFKPGLFRQLQAFLGGETADLLPAAEQLRIAREVYSRICPAPAWCESPDGGR